ncbi:MAG: carbohydrate ABC transporter permease [Anaerolineales bacterium]
METKARKGFGRFLSLDAWDRLGRNGLNILALGLLVLYLFPILFIVSTSLMPPAQQGDRNAPPYPAEQVRFENGGQALPGGGKLPGGGMLPVYEVLIDGEVRQLAMLQAGRQESIFVDPKDPQAEPLVWEGNWRGLQGVYRFSPTLENFVLFFDSLPFGRMVRNTLLAGLASGVFVLLSSVLVAYGFARFPLPGGDLLFYVLIASMLVPDKVTLVPSYFFFVRVLGWIPSWWPILAPFLFGNAVYIFLLRQNFKSLPKEMEEAATLDGAGPLRVLFQIVLPQSWPVLITVGLLHFFYIWNETRQAALYLSTARDLMPASYGVQAFQGLVTRQSVIQAGALLVMLVPIVVLMVSQKYFLRNLVITGMEK